MGTPASHLEQQSAAGAAPPEAKRRRRRAGACLILTTAGAALGLLSLRPQAPNLIWNFTQSVPLGLYGVAHTAPAKGDLVAIAPAGAMEEMLEAFVALPAGRLLLKHLAALPGDTVCRTRTSLTVNGVVVATAKLRSSEGRTLPAWSGCRTLGGGEILVLATHPSSFDGRYFGPIDAAQIVGVARPILTLPASPEAL